MNARRRKEIQKVLDILAGVSMEVEAILSYEETAFENIPESLEYSEQYENAERSVSNLQEAETYISETIDQLKSAIE